MAGSVERQRWANAAAMHLQRNVTTGKAGALPCGGSVSTLSYGRALSDCVGRNTVDTGWRRACSSYPSRTADRLYNAFTSRVLSSEWRRLRRHFRITGLLMLDVDHFKAFNDSVGPRQGTMPLKSWQRAIEPWHCRRRARGDGMPVRGEEFAIILRGPISPCAAVLPTAAQGRRVTDLPSLSACKTALP